MFQHYSESFESFQKTTTITHLGTENWHKNECFILSTVQLKQQKLDIERVSDFRN